MIETILGDVAQMQAFLGNLFHLRDIWLHFGLAFYGNLAGDLKILATQFLWEIESVVAGKYVMMGLRLNRLILDICGILARRDFKHRVR